MALVLVFLIVQHRQSDARAFTTYAQHPGQRAGGCQRVQEIRQPPAAAPAAPPLAATVSFPAKGARNLRLSAPTREKNRPSPFAPQGKRSARDKGKIVARLESLPAAVRAATTKPKCRAYGRHFSLRQVISTRTGISFLTGTVRSDGGSILKSESVAGMVP